MGLFSFLSTPDINEGVTQFKNTKGALLLDVRTAEEYRSGHIPGSRNLPLDTIRQIDRLTADKETPLFVHCLSGARSRQAASLLKKAGYTHVVNIGGIAGYRGKVER